MEPIRSWERLQEVLNQGRGFLANQFGHHFKVHNLQHLHNHCRGRFRINEENQKFFAEDTHHFDDAWGRENWDFCRLCQ